IDLPGFGHSDGRPELIAPDTSGVFLARLIDEWGLGAPHVVGPDVGTAAALFLAAKAPEQVTSLTVGGGAVRFPIEAGGALKDIIEAPSLDVQRAHDRSEEHTSELQSRGHLVCRLLLEKKKKKTKPSTQKPQPHAIKTPINRQ